MRAPWPEMRSLPPSFTPAGIRTVTSSPSVLAIWTVVPRIAETTALGAAYLAGIATGIWDPVQVEAMWQPRARFEPRIGSEEREELLAGWRRAVERAKGWASA